MMFLCFEVLSDVSCPKLFASNMHISSPPFLSQEPSDPDNPLAKGPSPKQVFLRDAGVCFPGLFVESPAPIPSDLVLCLST